MNEPVIVWVSIIVLTVVALVVRTVRKLHPSNGVRKHRRIIEFGKEAEMFYCPGDRYDNDEDL